MDDRLKQRLLGAVVVVALAVIFVPELLKDPEESEETVANTEMPPRPPQTFIEPDEDETVSLPLVTGSSSGEPPTAPDTQASLMPGPTDETLTSVESESARPIEPADGERTVTNAERGSIALENPVKPETDTPGITPNAAAVGESDSPDAPAQASVSSGVSSGVELNAAPLPPGVTRPESNPATDQSLTESSPAVTQPPNPDTAPTESITSSVDLPQVDLIGQSGIDNPSSVTPTDTTAMSQTGDWVVQAGSFSQQENANDLRDELIGQGFNAFVESSDTDGQTLYRVRIGPQSSRSQGESTLARLRALGFEGQVVSLRN